MIEMQQQPKQSKCTQKSIKWAYRFRASLVYFLDLKPYWAMSLACILNVVLILFAARQSLSFGWFRVLYRLFLGWLLRLLRP